MSPSFLGVLLWPGRDLLSGSLILLFCTALCIVLFCCADWIPKILKQDFAGAFLLVLIWSVVVVGCGWLPVLQAVTNHASHHLPIQKLINFHSVFLGSFIKYPTFNIFQIPFPAQRTKLLHALCSGHGPLIKTFWGTCTLLVRLWLVCEFLTHQCLSPTVDVDRCSLPARLSFTIYSGDINCSSRLPTADAGRHMTVTACFRIHETNPQLLPQSHQGELLSDRFIHT